MTTQMLMLIAMIVLMSGMIVAAFAGPNLSKASSRRLSAVKLRHSDSTEAQMEKQMRKAVASQYRPRSGRAGGRIDKLILRLQQTGKNIPLKRYLLICGGLGLGTFLILATRGTPLMLSLLVAAFVGLGLPHFIIGQMIKRRLASDDHWHQYAEGFFERRARVATHNFHQTVNAFTAGTELQT